MSANKTPLLARFRNWRRYRTTVRELQRLSPRQLDDLGIARGDIDEIARRAAL